MTVKIEIYDTTLRDGTQGEGVSFGLTDKLALSQDIDWLGVDFIEGGWPGSNPKDQAFFQEVAKLNLKQAKITAFGSTMRAKYTHGREDENLVALVDSGADVVTIFGKTWDLHVTDALRISLEKNLEIITKSLSFVKEQSGRPVFYDAEHFFDGYKANKDYALKTIKAALDGGAERIVLCDTNGGSLPVEVASAVDEIRAAFPEAQFGIHVHNDGGLAVANTLVAVEHGCMQVQGTINGIGERCGNVDLLTVIANLETKYNRKCLPEGNLSRLTALSRMVWERTNLQQPVNQPFVGKAAFAHKGGVHVSAVNRNADTYEHIKPELVGNTRRVLISELSGRSNINAKLSQKFPEIKDPKSVEAILNDIQEKENNGYSYEGADGSFELLVRRHLGKYNPLFKLIFYRIHDVGTGDHHGDRELIEATVKIDINGAIEHCCAEGHGPVDALSKALRKALIPTFPGLKELHLVDYKVRVINGGEGTAAQVRVLIEHVYKGEVFTTIGVSENIIDASWIALVEGYEHITCGL